MAPQNDNPAVIHHNRFGLAIPDLQWVPAPRYLLRRDVILRIVEMLTPGRIVELGCGAGALLDDFAQLGFTGIGVDQSDSARKIATALLRDTPGMEIAKCHSNLPHADFDYLAAFEVLEHIEDDHAALKDWATLLKPEGTLLISVPAHPDRWNPADVWAGHYRRYRREDVADLVNASGFELQQIQCYGYPLANIMERLSAGFYAKQTAKSARSEMDQNQRTEESGSDRSVLTRLWPLYGSFLGTLAMRATWQVQRAFLKSDRGIGYLAVARKI